ncbi:MAG: chorismate mutase [Acidobacteria bacterium]|nr:MAG: chorismate mutase [Acidobacteriota bacterium]
MRLEDSRKIIDDIDSEIVALLNRRASIARQIGRIKTLAGFPVVDHDREEMVLRKIVRDNNGEFDTGSMMRIYREVLEESRRIQTSVLLSTSTEEVSK